MKRDIIEIDEEKCNGCGDCISGCPEGAIQLIDGKARLVSDLFCDGLGACIGNCPRGAIRIENREAEPYDEAKVMANIIKGGDNVIKAHLQHLYEHGEKDLLLEAIDILKSKNIEVPDFKEIKEVKIESGQSKNVDIKPELRNWPIQLQLINPNLPSLKNADLLIAADCAPFAYPNFHNDFIKDKVLIILCPKLDTVIEQYINKLIEIFKNQDINSITIAKMEVPCCSGIEVIIQRALDKAGVNIPIENYTIGINGEIK